MKKVAVGCGMGVEWRWYPGLTAIIPLPPQSYLTPIQGAGVGRLVQKVCSWYIYIYILS